MKISYKLPGTADWHVLCDETGSVSTFPHQLGDPTGTGIPTDWAPTFTVRMQEEPLAVSTRQFRQPLGNIRVSFPVSFNVEYETRAAALAAYRAIATTLLNIMIHLKVSEGPEPGALPATEVQFYPRAMITDWSPKVIGRTVEHRMTISSDNVTDVEPT